MVIYWEFRTSIGQVGPETTLYVAMSSFHSEHKDGLTLIPLYTMALAKLSNPVYTSPATAPAPHLTLSRLGYRACSLTKVSTLYG